MFAFFKPIDIPENAISKNVLIAYYEDLVHASLFLEQLQKVVNDFILLRLEEHAIDLPYPQVFLPREQQVIKRFFKKLNPKRLIFIGRAAEQERIHPFIHDAIWINAANIRINIDNFAFVSISHQNLQSLYPNAYLTGDPLLNIQTKPGIAKDPELCDRFKEFREREQWVGYFAATGEGEEALAYSFFFQFSKVKQGILVLAPADPCRYESVYRASLQYNLPTNRHNRLMTSYIPKTSRVYYIEDGTVLQNMYRCADFVVIGGTLGKESTHMPDIITPLCCGSHIIVGPYNHDAAIRSAIEADLVSLAEDMEAIMAFTKKAIEEQKDRKECTHAWLRLQIGACERVINTLREHFGQSI